MIALTFAALAAALAGGWPAIVHAQAPSAPLRTGDRVFVRVGSDTVWSDSLVVDGAGRIFVPRIGAVPLQGVAADSVAVTVRQALSSIYRTSDATVLPLRRVTVTGEVRKPGVYFLPLESTLRDAVSVAEGAAEMGNPSRMTMIRDGAQTTLRHWLTSADGALFVMSGDVLIIDRDSWLKRNMLATISTVGLLVTTIVAVTR